jgi:hypothetical protein
VADSKSPRTAFRQADVKQARAGTHIGPSHAKIENQRNIPPSLAQPPGEPDRGFKGADARDKKLMGLAGLFPDQGYGLHLCGDNEKNHGRLLKMRLQGTTIRETLSTIGMLRLNMHHILDLVA